MLDDITIQRLERLKNHIGLSSIHPDFNTRGASNCPFCNKKGKGYIVDDQFFKCYSSRCATQGDLVSIYRKLHGLEGKGSFFTAISELEKLAGLSDLTETNDERSELLGEVVDTYASILWTSEGREALKYLKSRGFDDISLNMYQVGYAPQGSTLLKYGFDINKLSQHQLYDRRHEKEYFSNRITFPIRDMQGKYVHIVGRWLGDVPKDENGDDKWLRYKDSKGPITSKNYFAFEHLIPAFSLRNKPYLVLTEGFPDALTLNQAGIPAIAILGLEGLLKQYQKFKDLEELIVVADNDYFAEDHPLYPLEYKSWRRLIPQLVELQIMLPQVKISWLMVPEGGTTSRGISYSCKDVNDWYNRSGMSSRDLQAHIIANKQELVPTLIEKWGPDLSRHLSLIRLITATGSDVRQLERYIPVGWSPITYASQVFSS
jgi:hypothetical protein